MREGTEVLDSWDNGEREEWEELKYLTVRMMERERGREGERERGRE